MTHWDLYKRTEVNNPEKMMSAIFEQTGLDNLFTTEQTNFIYTGGNPQEKTALENAATQIVSSDRKTDVFLRQI